MYPSKKQTKQKNIKRCITSIRTNGHPPSRIHTEFPAIQIHKLIEYLSSFNSLRMTRLISHGKNFPKKFHLFFCCWIQPIHFCFVFFAISRLTSYFLFVIHLYIGNFVYLWMDKTISLSLSWAWHNHHHNHSIYFTFLCNQFIILFHSINKHRHLSNTFEHEDIQKQNIYHIHY